MGNGFCWSETSQVGNISNPTPWTVWIGGNQPHAEKFSLASTLLGSLSNRDMGFTWKIIYFNISQHLSTLQKNHPRCPHPPSNRWLAPTAWNSARPRILRWACRNTPSGCSAAPAWYGAPPPAPGNQWILRENWNRKPPWFSWENRWFPVKIFPNKPIHWTKKSSTEHGQIRTDWKKSEMDTKSWHWFSWLLWFSTWNQKSLHYQVLKENTLRIIHEILWWGGSGQKWVLIYPDVFDGESWWIMPKNSYNIA